MLKIGVFDSGVGGLNLLGALDKITSGVTYYYYGDNDNAPYGNANINRLRALTHNCVFNLITEGVDAIVIGCNTVSTTLINEIKSWVNIPVFGVFPPVEKPLINGEKTLLLCTERTAEFYRNYGNLSICVLKGVVDEIENFYNDIYHCKLENSKNRPLLQVSPLLSELLSGQKGKFETVILGCTHYFFQKIGIVDHLAPRKILDGVEFTAKIVSKYFNNEIRKEKPNENQFIFLGDNAKLNSNVFFEVVLNNKNTKKFAKKFDFFIKSG